MKKIALLFALAFLALNFTYSQKNNPEINERYTENSLFLFNSFHKGIAYFNDGGISEAKYNYNTVHDKICYVQNKQIYEISNASELDSLKINNVTLYCNNEKIYELLAGNEIKILLRRKADLSATKPEGAYGTSSTTSAVSKKTSIYTGKGVWGGEHVNIQNQNDIEIPILNKYYLLVNNEVIHASKYLINKYFKDNKTEIKNFIKENGTNFHEINDLKSMASFLEKFI